MKGKALSILLYVTAAAISCQNAPVTEENPGEDGSPIIEFSDPKFLEALLRPCIPYPDMNGDGRISEKEAASIFAISCSSFEIKDYTIVEQIAESIREEYGDIVEYR